MNTEYRNLGRTRLHVTCPWGLMLRKGSRFLCADGKVRAPAYLATTAETFFSTPCAMRVKGRYVAGYMASEETEDGSLRAFVFRKHNGQEGLPPWPCWPNLERTENWELWKAQCDEADKAKDALIRSVHPEGGAK